MSTSPFDHPFLSGLLGDAAAAEQFSAAADLAAMLTFEAALAEAQGAAGVIPAPAAAHIAATVRGLALDPASLAAGVAQDGVVVPVLVKMLRQAVGEPFARFVHVAATSQDVIDTSLVLRLRPLLALYESRLTALIGRLEALLAEQGDRPLMAHTRMQAALPITAARKLAGWHAPLVRLLDKLPALRADLLVLQFGGAVGTREGMGDQAEQVAAGLADRLNLTRADPWHAERDRIGSLAAWLSLVSGSLGKLGQDIALMAQNELHEVRLAGGGGSSAMPHKSNPVPAEILVTLARFNAGLLGTLHQALVHENERSGAAWTLEWLLLPQMATATASGLRLAMGMLDGIQIAPPPAER